MADIKTLVKDIYALFDPKKNFEVKEGDLLLFSKNVAAKIKSKLSDFTLKPGLRMSNIGKVCTRELWYSQRTPEDAEHLQPHTYIKFLFGDILEELLLLLARVAGHDVQNEQMPVEVDGLRGRIDATIDGVLVDAKSASSIAFKKFENHLDSDNDSFGYLSQLGLYRHALKSHTPDIKAGFLAIDKQNGNIVLDLHNRLGDNLDYSKYIADRRAMVESDTPPPRAFQDEDQVKPSKSRPNAKPNGNRVLGTNCSYCPFKFKCWPGLKAYYYAKGPVYFTKVVKEPRVVSSD